MTRPTPKEVKAVADVAGVPVDAEVATRMEPATFLLAQRAKVLT
jgi:hypothetical protein